MNQLISPYIDPDGIWAEVRVDISNRQTPLPALFLDRDGVIVEEVLYLHRPEEMKLIPGAVSTIAIANDRGIPVIVVTNQAGIGRGYYGWDDFIAVQASMIKELDRLGARIDAVFACPYHADGQGPFIQEDHPDRKPNPGMLQKAAKELILDLSKSWIAGDRASDLAAGHAAGCEGGVHLKTGHGHSTEETERALAYASRTFRVEISSSIAELTRIIPLLD